MSLHAIIIVTTLSIAAAVLWVDPRRLASQAYGLIALVCAAWVFHLWVLAELRPERPVAWLRSVAIVVAFLPWTIWWAGECILQPVNRWRSAFFHGWPWLIVACFLGLIASTDWYIPHWATREKHAFGPAYMPYQLGLLSICLSLLIRGWVKSRSLHGRKKLDYQVLVIGGAVACLLGVGVSLVFRILRLPNLAYVTPIICFAFFIGGVWVAVSQRGPAGRHQFVAIVRRTLLLLGVTIGALAVMKYGEGNLPAEMLVLPVVAVSAVLVLVLEGRLRGAQSWLMGDENEVAAANLRRLSARMHRQINPSGLAGAAEQIAGILECGHICLYWRQEQTVAFALVSRHPDQGNVPGRLPANDTLAEESMAHEQAWLIPVAMADSQGWLSPYKVCVPVVEAGAAQLLILVGASERTLGYSAAEISALHSIGVAANHLLVMREMVARQAEQEQLALAGKLAAGIAHNIRNPLAVVRACLEVDPALPNGAARELHEAAAVKVRSIQSTVDSLSALARGERFALERHDLALLIRGVLVDHADYLVQCGARVIFAAKEGASWGLVEPHQLTIALTNLVRNAAEEVAKNPEGGTISIDVLRSPENLSTIRVADTGRGLPEHIVDAVFSRDLFAKTTKAEGRPARKTGYGIGLHSTMMIITTGHGGRFEYRDGAFHVSVPAAD